MSREACADVSLELNRHIVNLLDSLSALSGLTTIPIRDIDEAALLRHALEALMENQDMERCSIFLLDDDGGLTNAAGRDWDDMLDGITQHAPPHGAATRTTTHFRVGEGIMGRAAASRAIEHCRSCRDDAHFAQLAGKSVEGSLLCVPIACEEGVLGVLNVYHPQAGFFNLWHERLLLLYCQVLGRLLLHHRFTHHLGQLVARKTAELEQQRHFLQTVLDSAPDPMMVIGNDYRVLLSNRPGSTVPSGQDAYCYSISHHRDSPCDGIEHPCPLRAVHDSGAAVTVIHEHFDAAGNPRIVELLASPLHDNDNGTCGIVETARDITARKQIAEALEKSEARLRTAERLAQLGSWELDLKASKLTWSDEVFRIFEIDAAQFAASYDAFIAAVHPEDRERVNIAFGAAVKNHLPYDITHRLQLQDGSIKYVHETGQIHYGADGTPLRATGAVQDVTLQVLNEESLRESEERFRTIADHTFDWEYWRGPGGEFLYISPSCQRLTGYAQAEFIGRPALMQEIVHPDDRALVTAHADASADSDTCQLEFRIVTKNGEVRWISHVCRAVFSRAGAARGRRGSNRDITERKDAEARIRQLAYFDPLTGLPNRRMLIDRLDHALSQAKRHQRPLAVMFMDLDHFKRINDTLGHDVGDALLKEVATRLNHCVRAGDTVARQGGDEFVIVLAEIATAQDAASVAEKILKSFDEPVPVADKRLSITTSIGIAVYPTGGTDTAQDLMKKADMAMYAAKEGGRNGYRFHAEGIAPDARATT